MAITHDEIIDYMKHLGYESNAEGVCYGVAYMGLQAILAQELPVFDERLKKILTDKNNDYQLTDIERGKLGITPFLDGVELYFQAWKYPQLFEEGEKPKIQHATMTAPLVNSIKIEEQGGLYEAPSFSGVYDKNELIDLFAALEGVVRDSNPEFQKPLGFVLNSGDHSITVAFEPAQNRWILINAGQLPTKYLTNKDELATNIMSAFGADSKSKVIFSTFPSTTGENKKVFSKIIKAWKETPSWIAHKVSEEKAQFIDISRASWLFVAAQNGHLFVVKVLLAQKDIDFNQVNNRGATPLFIAAQNGHVKTVKALLKKGVNPNQADFDGLTPLRIAAQKGQNAVVKVLLAQKDIDIYQGDKNGFGPLHAAAEHGHVEVVKTLLAHPGIDFNQVNNDGATPLYIAAQNGHIEVIKTLLAQKDINFNQPNKNGATPLSIAAQKGHIDIVKLLLKKGAEVNQASNDGVTPLYIAALNGHVEVVKALLAQKRVDINQVTVDGATPLFIAARNGHLEVVKELLAQEGIEINHGINFGTTPLHIAAGMGHVEIVEALLAHQGIDFNAINNIRATPLFCAAEMGHVGSVKILLAQKGIDVNQAIDGVTPFNGATAQRIAELNGHTEIAKILSEYKETELSKEGNKRRHYLPQGAGDIEKLSSGAAESEIENTPDPEQTPPLSIKRNK